MSTPDNPIGDPNDPFSAMFGAVDPSQMGAAFTQIGAMLSYEGAVNWKLAADTAHSALSESTDPAVTAADRASLDEAMRLAELWLDAATIFPASGTGVTAWNRRQWIDSTLDGWKVLVEPLATRAGEAMGTVLPQSMPGEVAAMAGPLAGMFKQLGGAMFGMQLGQGLASLSHDVLGAADVGVPLSAAGSPALVPTNITAFGDGLGVPADQVLLYVALREAAHQRLFAHVPWLRGRIAASVEDYARGIHVDTDNLEQAMGTLDPSDPAALQEALSSGMFQPADTDEQKAALARLETLLALVEGWVDAVVGHATEGTLPSASSLRETIRRRRATGGPAEQTFATLVGLELRPRRLREASQLWDELLEHRGLEGRDAVWEHPDLLPSAEDLDDVDTFVHRTGLDLSGLADLGVAPTGESPAEAAADAADTAEAADAADPGTAASGSGASGSGASDTDSDTGSGTDTGTDDSSPR